MKVKITGYSGGGECMWYKFSIGKIFEVNDKPELDNFGFEHYLYTENNWTGLISTTDCIDIRKLRQQKSKRLLND
jgi:hypothetical protein